MSLFVKFHYIYVYMLAHVVHCLEALSVRKAAEKQLRQCRCSRMLKRHPVNGEKTRPVV
jgi:hypothetical protein